MTGVTVRVPATAANLGPGFDALGMALRLHNRIRVSTGTSGIRVTVRGEGAGQLDTGPENLVYRAISRLYREVGATPPAVEIVLENAIPVSRGLGSSSSAIVGGLVAANALLGGPLEPERILALAVEMEGHPDNVTPALLGGFHAMSLSEEGLLHLALPVPAGLRAVVCIPDLRISTSDARGVLPERYSRADAVFNVGRVALLLAALLTGQTQMLRAAMQDRLHQPYRAALVPGFHAALSAAVGAGAAGACLSGSGPTLLALTATAEPAVGAAMVAAFAAAGVAARWLALDVDLDGAVVEESGE